MLNSKSIEQIRVTAFEDEIKKIAAKEEVDEAGNLKPGHWKSYAATLKTLFKHPIKTMGPTIGGELVGGAGGAAGGALAGLGVAGVARLLKKHPSFKAAAGIGALAGGYGGMVGGAALGYQRAMRNQGIKVGPVFFPPYTRATLSPAAQKDLNIHPKSK
jgi:hypothetical protein